MTDPADDRQRPTIRAPRVVIAAVAALGLVAGGMAAAVWLNGRTSSAPGPHDRTGVNFAPPTTPTLTVTPGQDLTAQPVPLPTSEQQVVLADGQVAVPVGGGRWKVVIPGAISQDVRGMVVQAAVQEITAALADPGEGNVRLLVTLDAQARAVAPAGLTLMVIYPNPDGTVTAWSSIPTEANGGASTMFSGPSASSAAGVVYLWLRGAGIDLGSVLVVDASVHRDNEGARAKLTEYARQAVAGALGDPATLNAALDAYSRAAELDDLTLLVTYPQDGRFSAWTSLRDGPQGHGAVAATADEVRTQVEAWLDEHRVPADGIVRVDITSADVCSGGCS